MTRRGSARPLLALLLLSAPAPAARALGNPFKSFKLPRLKLPQGPTPADTMRFEAGLKSFELRAGLAAPTDTNGFRDAVSAGPVGGFQFLYYPWDWTAFGVEADYLKFLPKTIRFHSSQLLLDPPPALPFTLDLEQEAQVLAANFIVRINLREEASWTPYLLGGAGFNRFEYRYRAVTDAAVSGFPLVIGPTSAATAGKISSTGLSVTGGAGLEAFLIRGMSLALEARYHEFRLRRDRFDADRAESLSYRLGLRFYYGGE